MLDEIPNSDRFIHWLEQNIDDVRAGEASFEGFPVTVETRVRQYQTAVSCFFITFVTPSRLYVEGHDNHWMGSLRCSIATLLLGWWGLPWGPLQTISCLLGNLFGGTKEIVANLIDEVTGHTKSVVQLTERAADLARRRIAERGYPPETALAVRVGDEFGPEYEVRYDLPESDGRQWCCISHGITVLVEKEEEEMLEGLIVDEEDGEFVFR